jgi:hypothetical protein
MSGVGVRAASLLIFCRWRVLLQSDLPRRAANEEACDRRLARRRKRAVLRADPFPFDKLERRAGLHHNLDRVIRAARDGIDDAPHLQGDARAARVNRFVRHVDVFRQASVRRKRGGARALTELPGVFSRLPRRSRFGARQGQISSQTVTLPFQFGKLLPQLLKSREVILREQRHVQLDRSVSMVQLCFERGDAIHVLLHDGSVDAGGRDDVEIVDGPGKHEVLKIQVVEVSPVRTAVPRVR